MKDIIFYHRAYRRVLITDRHIFLEALFLTLPLLIAVGLLYPEITFLMNRFARYVLLTSLPAADIEIIRKPYIYSSVYVLGLHANYPSVMLSFSLFLFSLLSISLAPITKVPRPIVAWVIFLSSINLISSIFFILSPSIFPYDIEKFSEFYVKADVSIWLFVPVVMGATLLFIPSNILVKFSIMVLTLLYSVVFGTMRYAVFLYILKKFSYLFMPLLFLAFGPLIDFTYMVGIYSLYCSIIARKRNNRAEIGPWRWL